jgi:prevent-host-death family protein
MTERISQRELRNRSGEIMRELDRGADFVVTRNGVPVGNLTPARRRRFVHAGAVVTAFANAPEIDADQLRADLDRDLDQDPTPRG